MLPETKQTSHTSERVRVLEWRIRRLEAIVLRDPSIASLLQKIVGLQLSGPKACLLYAEQTTKPFNIYDVYTAMEGYLTRDNIRMSLCRLVEQGYIRRIRKGLYEYLSSDTSGAISSKQAVAR